MRKHPQPRCPSDHPAAVVPINMPSSRGVSCCGLKGKRGAGRPPLCDGLPGAASSEGVEKRDKGGRPLVGLRYTTTNRRVDGWFLVPLSVPDLLDQPVVQRLVGRLRVAHLQRSVPRGTNTWWAGGQVGAWRTSSAAAATIRLAQSSHAAVPSPGRELTPGADQLGVDPCSTCSQGRAPGGRLRLSPQAASDLSRLRPGALLCCETLASPASGRHWRDRGTQASEWDCSPATRRGALASRLPCHATPLLKI